MADKDSPWAADLAAPVALDADDKDALIRQITAAGVQAFTDHADLLDESDCFQVTMTALDTIAAMVISVFIHDNKDCAQMVVDQHADNTLRVLERSIRAKKGH